MRILLKINRTTLRDTRNILLLDNDRVVKIVQIKREVIHVYTGKNEKCRNLRYVITADSSTHLSATGNFIVTKL